MKLIDALEAIRFDATEVDVKVCYENEFGEECTKCNTFVDEEVFKEGKKYWAEDRVVKYRYGFPKEKLERYFDFDVFMLKAEGKNHFFIYASNFH